MISEIINISMQIEAVAKRIQTLSAGVENVNSDTRIMMEDMIIDEVKHSQLLTIELTKIARNDFCLEDEPVVAVHVENVDEAGSVFEEGELTENLGEKEQEKDRGGMQ